MRMSTSKHEKQTKMKTFLNIAGVIVILILAITLMQTCQSNRETHALKEANERAYLERIAHEQAEKLRRDTVILETQINRDIERQEYKRSKAKDSTTIARLRRREWGTRTDTFTRTIVDTLFMAYDSALIRCAEYIKDQDSSYMTEIKLLNQNVASLQRQFNAADSIAKEHFNEVKPSRLSLSLSGGYGMIGNENRVSGGFFFGPSISYRINLPTWRELFKRK